LDRQFTEERDATEDCFSRVLLPVSVHAQQPAVPRMSYFNGALKAAGGNPQTVRYVTATCGSRVPDLQDLMPFSATEATPTRGRHTVQEAQRLPRLEVWARLRMARWYVYRRLWRGGSDGIDAYYGSSGYAAVLNGNVEIAQGILSAPLREFKIDHPQDPANKYLVHASIESSENDARIFRQRHDRCRRRGRRPAAGLV
jgi:hypothetical protein